MAKVPGFAKAYAGRWAHRRNGHQATLANAAQFFNSLLDRAGRQSGVRCAIVVAKQMRKRTREFNAAT